METIKAKILIVDDLPEKLLAYRTVLADLDQEIVAARSGEEALRAVLRDEFAVILLDVNMPGIDGLETAALIRRRKKSAHTPIIFVTAFADDVRVTQGYAHGAVDYIHAPIVPEVLRAKVRVFVDLYQMGQRIKQQALEQVALAEEVSKRAAAEEANCRLRFLAELSKALADSLDCQTTARTVARLVVPFAADFAAVALPTESASAWQVEASWLHPVDRQLYDRFAWPGDGSCCEVDAAVARVFRTGDREVLTQIDVGLATLLPVGSPAHGRLASAVVLPLRARGRTLGVLVLGFTDAARQYGPAELSLVDDVASRVGTALDNVRLYEDVQQADRQKNEFLSMLAHELRNPLSPVRNAVEAMRLCEPNDPSLVWAREVIDRQVRHLIRLVDDLLDVSRITQGKIRLKFEPVELSTVLGQAVEASAPEINARSHRLHTTWPNEPVWISGDPTRLSQVFTNLLNNAAKYTYEGGRIWLSLKAEGGQAVVRIRDTGVGIPQHLVSAVFDLFMQVDRSLDRSQGGLGIGLTLVRQLVELHGGSVKAASAGPGEGSEFVVLLPLLGERPVASSVEPEVSHGEQTKPNGLRVLIVDDNVDGAVSLGYLLKLQGHVIELAHTGGDALQLIGDFHPELAILDIGLPGMDGYEVARRIRQSPGGDRICLVALTGYGRDEDRLNSTRSGFDHHFVKPVDLKELSDLIDSTRDSRREVTGAMMR